MFKPSLSRLPYIMGCPAPFSRQEVCFHLSLVFAMVKSAVGLFFSDCVNAVTLSLGYLDQKAIFHAEWCRFLASEIQRNLRILRKIRSIWYPFQVVSAGSGESVYFTHKMPLFPFVAATFGFCANLRKTSLFCCRFLF